jgi:lipopolysaccharide-binding protein
MLFYSKKILYFTLFIYYTINSINNNLLPGVKLTLSQNALNYLKDVGMKILEQKLSTLSIPDLNGNEKSPIGDIKWSLNSIKLTNIQIPQTSIHIVPNVGLQIFISNLGIHLNLHWHYSEKSWPHIGDSGTADIDSSGISASVELKIIEESQKPKVYVVSSSVSISSLNIHLHGGASWLYNFFINILHDKIKNSIQDALNRAIKENIENGLNKVLSTLPVEIKINNEVKLNYGMIGNPIFTSNYLSLGDLGEFYSIVSPQECPINICIPSKLPESVTKEMLQIFIDDFVPNSAGFVFWKLNHLSTIITDKNIPSWSPIRLNTSSFEYLIPILYKNYPNKLLQIQLYATQSPKLIFSKQGSFINVIGKLDMDVILNNGTIKPVFSLQGDISLAGEALLNELLIIGNLTFLQVNFKLSNSDIGPFDPAVLNNYLNLLFTKGIVPFVNNVLIKGFPLPSVKGIFIILF